MSSIQRVFELFCSINRIHHLIFSHGADPDARAKNRYSALLVAAQYTGSSAAMNLLLDHGAKVRLPKGQGAPFFNAFPVMLARWPAIVKLSDVL
jgi:ankyrin repeat protein